MLPAPFPLDSEVVHVLNVLCKVLRPGPPHSRCCEIVSQHCFASTALQTALRKGKGEEATRLYELSQETIGNATDDVDWYQVLLHHIPDDEAAATLKALWGASLKCRDRFLCSDPHRAAGFVAK